VAEPEADGEGGGEPELEGEPDGVATADTVPLPEGVALRVPDREAAEDALPVGLREAEAVSEAPADPVPLGEGKSKVSSTPWGSGTAAQTRWWWATLRARRWPRRTRDADAAGDAVEEAEGDLEAVAVGTPDCSRWWSPSPTPWT
jgi:hypothetical protein